MVTLKAVLCLNGLWSGHYVKTIVTLAMLITDECRFIKLKHEQIDSFSIAV
jgi:hypothetical protein